MAPTLRERKREQTRREIADAALALMARDGYAATTMAAIADAAQVSRRTVFRYFSDKEEAVFADLREHTELILGAVAAAPPQAPPLDVVRRAGRALAEELGRDPAALRRWLDLVASEPALQARHLAKQRHWEALLGDALAAREPAAGDRARLAAVVGVACVRAALEAWERDPAMHLPDRVDEAFAALREVAAS